MTEQKKPNVSSEHFVQIAARVLALLQAFKFKWMNKVESQTSDQVLKHDFE